jgi:predicted component of type VI protein secretion system
MNKLFVGIDVHLKRHFVSIVPITMFQDNKTEWKRTKSIIIGNNCHDFEHLNLLLKSQNALTNQVSIAIDSKSSNDFKDYYEKQVQKGKPRIKALVATMGKLAEIIYHCLKFNEPYQYQSSNHLDTKF